MAPALQQPEKALTLCPLSTKYWPCHKYSHFIKLSKMLNYAHSPIASGETHHELSTWYLSSVSCIPVTRFLMWGDHEVYKFLQFFITLS